MQTFTLQTQKTCFQMMFFLYPLFTVNLFIFIKIQTSYSTNRLSLQTKIHFWPKKEKYENTNTAKRKRKVSPFWSPIAFSIKKSWYKMFCKSFNPTSKRTKTWNSTLRTPIWQMCTWIFLIEAKKRIITTTASGAAVQQQQKVEKKNSQKMWWKWEWGKMKNIYKSTWHFPEINFFLYSFTYPLIQLPTVHRRWIFCNECFGR